MTLKIKIHRDRNKDGSFHRGIIEFENGQIIPFEVTDSELKEIHYEQLLRDTHTENGLNIYQATFELTNEKK